MGKKGSVEIKEYYLSSMDTTKLSNNNSKITITFNYPVREKGKVTSKRIYGRSANRPRNSVLYETDVIHQVSGIAKLHEAISLEHTRGLGHLHRLYNRYFAIPLATLLSKPVIFQKQWFLVIRTAREATDIFIYDDFATNPSLHSWVGLPPLPDI